MCALVLGPIKLFECSQNDHVYRSFELLRLKFQVSPFCCSLFSSHQSSQTFLSPNPIQVIQPPTTHPPTHPSSLQPFRKGNLPEDAQIQIRQNYPWQCPVFPEQSWLFGRGKQWWKREKIEGGDDDDKVTSVSFGVVAARGKERGRANKAPFSSPLPLVSSSLGGLGVLPWQVKGASPSPPPGKMASILNPAMIRTQKIARFSDLKGTSKKLLWGREIRNEMMVLGWLDKVFLWFIWGACTRGS